MPTYRSFYKNERGTHYRHSSYGQWSLGTRSDPAGLVWWKEGLKARFTPGVRTLLGPHGSSDSHPSLTLWHSYKTHTISEPWISSGSPCRFGTRSDPAGLWPGLMEGRAEGQSYWYVNLVGATWQLWSSTLDISGHSAKKKILFLLQNLLVLC